MKSPASIDTTMLAPCGLNCLLCYRHLGKHPCPGCRAKLPESDTYQNKCVMRTCTTERGLTTCAECKERPCKRVKAFAKRYRDGYGVDLAADAMQLRSEGAEALLQQQIASHTCQTCGHLIDLHYGKCSGCGRTYPIGKGRNQA
jgi:hypothetical protein